MLDNLQQSRDLEIRASQQQQHEEERQRLSAAKTRQRRRQLLAAVACLGAAVTVFPGGWQQLTEAPVVSWLLAGAALVLLWPRDTPDS